MDSMLENAVKVLNVFNDNGYEAYIVGGFVRDYLLGVESHDIDITTNCPYELILTLFKSGFKKSDKYKTAVVRMNGFEYEVTPYRAEEGYTDHRHPDVKVASSLIEDLKRRDFTINAMCLDKDLKVIDLVGGEKDLKKKIIRTVGKPNERFFEDALRMFRAFRFASRLNFKIERKTLKAINKNSYLSAKISKERIYDELSKSLNTEHFKSNLKIMLKSGLYEPYPEIENALNILSLNYNKINIVELLSLASYISLHQNEELLLSKKEQILIKKSCEYMKLIENKKINKIDLLDLDIDALKVSYKIARILLLSTVKYDSLIKIYEELPIKSRKEYDLNGSIILKVFNLKPSPIVKEYLDIGLDGVVNKGIENNKYKITEYIKEVISKNV